MSPRSTLRSGRRLAAAALLLPLSVSTAAAQRPHANGSIDPARAVRLYVSDRPEDHTPGWNYARDVRDKARTDSIYEAVSRGELDYRKVTYRSGVDGLEIPAYLFQPLRKRGARGHAAMVWLHGGVHGDWSAGMYPFVREAVERGYVVIAPEYRGSTGYGREFHEAIDYGGYEVDDALAAVDYLASLPHVDTTRVGVMGWSHGGYIALLAATRDAQPFRAAAALVPVTNLVFRLSYKGPEYQRLFATQQRIRGLPFERRELYVERSPVYRVDRLQVPVLVHLATNDDDVDFVEAEMLVNALRVKKPELAETRIYTDPPGGHSFCCLVDFRSMRPVGTPEQRDSWNRVWTFLEWNLRPYQDPSLR